MVTYVNITGYDEFVKYLENICSDDVQIYFYFSGSKLSEGISWCPDCVEAEPVVKSYLNELDRSIVFVYVDVGNREYWKDRNCPFRTDNRTKLMVIPTIIKWKGVQRLEGSQCTKRELLEMMFTDED